MVVARPCVRTVLSILWVLYQMSCEVYSTVLTCEMLGGTLQSRVWPPVLADHTGVQSWNAFNPLCKVSIQWDGLERFAWVVFPEYEIAVNRSRSERLATVLAFHGYTNMSDFSAARRFLWDLAGRPTAAEMNMMLSGFGSMAMSNGDFISVFPQGTGGDNDQAWNAGGCCGRASALYDDIDDVGFVRALLDHLMNSNAAEALDSERVYATGFSNGAMMSYRLACELSDRIAAIGAVSGTAMTFLDLSPEEALAGEAELQRLLSSAGVVIDPLPPSFTPDSNLSNVPHRSELARRTPQCANSHPVSVMHIHGTADSVVPFPATTIFPYDVPKTMEAWRFLNNCSSHQGGSRWVQAGRFGASTRCFRACGQGLRTVQLCIVAEGGHAYPGAPESLHVSGAPDFAASQEIWRFFQPRSLSHYKPAGQDVSDGSDAGDFGTDWLTLVVGLTLAGTTVVCVGMLCLYRNRMGRKLRTPIRSESESEHLELEDEVSAAHFVPADDFASLESSEQVEEDIELQSVR